MKICIPIEMDLGMISPVSAHFGRAPKHALVDLETGGYEVLLKPAEGEHGHCLPVRFLETRGVGTVICKGIGRGALARLKETGIEVLAMKGENLGEVLEAYRAGQLSPFDSSHICAGHHH